jgi:pyridoxal phosphate enzyme (YggS family)
MASSLAGVTDSERVNQIRARLLAVRQRMAAAALRAGRDPAEIILVAVSKTHPPEWVRAAALAGQRVFGENRIEEAGPKMLDLAGEGDLEWHMIGRVQSRKAREVSEAGFALVHSVDSLKLALRLGQLADKAGRRESVLLEINVSGEASKAGFAAAQPEHWPNLLPIIKQVAELPGLELLGLMTMAPRVPEPALARPHFERLAQFRDYLIDNGVLGPGTQLSMGMTDDFEVAIEVGATIVRIGRAIFDERE